MSARAYLQEHTPASFQLQWELKVNYFLPVWGTDWECNSTDTEAWNAAGYKRCQQQVRYLLACPENKPPLTAAGLASQTPLVGVQQQDITPGLAHSVLLIASKKDIHHNAHNANE